MGTQLSIDETSLSHGELYTVVTNKKARGKKGAIVAIVEGTKAEDVARALENIPLSKRKKVEEITLDLAANMELIAKRSFPAAKLVTDRFHVQQLATEALQEIRIKHRWEAIDAENDAFDKAKAQKKSFVLEILEDGDTLKQMLARSRYILYKRKQDWTPNQQARAAILFNRYPDIESAYDLSQELTAGCRTRAH